MDRSSGIIMPIFSLPSRYGIGSMGKSAYAFADFLHEAGQRYWQVLPLNPTSFGDSPYQSPSVFAGDPYFIDIDLLTEDGLLTQKEADECAYSGDPRYVDYEFLYDTRLELLARAKRRGWKRDSKRISLFLHKNARWLQDYALFMALKRHFNMLPWQDWPDNGARSHADGALKVWFERLKDDVELFIYVQYLFFEQWDRLRTYANGLDIRFIGDIPIYAAYDSSDVWSNRTQFMLDENGAPLEVAGVPPDYFSEDGQLWGNPLYRWDRMANDGFCWWLGRIGNAYKLYDSVRIDHFRGLESCWAVAAGETTARNGRWLKGPGMRLVNAIKTAFPELSIIAEDLGLLTPEVDALLQASGFPGMKVLQFAFGEGGQGKYLPHNYDKNCVCYTGTHDNSPLALWLEEANAEEIAFARKYLALNENEGFVWGIIRGGMASPAELFVAQMQDYLCLGAGHRTNTPGMPHGNWRWRMLEGEASHELAARIMDYTVTYGRH